MRVRSMHYESRNDESRDDESRDQRYASASWSIRLLAYVVSLSLCLGHVFFAPPSLLAEPASTEAKEPIELPGGRRWIEVKTPHFTLYGDASKRKISRVGRDLERLRTVLSKMTVLELQAPVPVSVFVFRSDESFGPYRHLRPDGQPARMGGAYYRRSHGSFISMNARFGADTTRTIQHEYVHFFLANNIPWVPLWFNEGLAEFYSTFEAFDEHVNVGKVDEYRLRQLSGHTQIPLRDLLAADFRSPYYFEKEHQGDFYGLSWAFVHYLLLGNPERRPQLFAFLEAQRHLPLDEAFAKAFGTEYEVLESELRGYLRETLYPYDRLELSSAETDDDFAVREMDRAETLARLGEFLAIQNRPIDAEGHLRAALALDEARPRAHVGLGLIAERAGEIEEAVEHYDRAATLAPYDPVLRFLRARARFTAGGDRSKIREDLYVTVESRKRFAAAWDLWARTFDPANDDPEVMIPIFVKLVELEPDRPSHAVTLLRLYERANEEKAAKNLREVYFAPRGLDPAESLASDSLETVEHPKSGEELKIARMPRGDTPEGRRYREAWQEASRLADEERYAEAVAVLETLENDWSDSVPLVERLAELREAAARGEKISAHQDLAARYREAKEHYDAQRWKSAQEVLEALLADVEDDPEWRGRVEQFLTSVRAVRKTYGDGEG